MADLGLSYEVLDQQFDSEMLMEHLENPEVSDDELNDEFEPKYSPLEKVFLYSKSDLTAHRIWIAQELPDLVREIEAQEAIEYVIPLLYELGSDDEDKVREIFAENLDQVLLYFYQTFPPSTTGESCEVNQLTPNSFSLLLRTLILEWNTIIASAAQKCIVSLAKNLPKDLVDQEIVHGIIIQLGNGEGCLRVEEKDQGKAAMLKTMAILAEVVDASSITDIFIPTLSQVVADPTFGVRKEIPAVISAVIKVVSKDVAVETLLPLYERLAGDDIWQVRKSCALVLPEICASVPTAAQLEKCLPIFDAMATDVSRWVQTCAEDGLGRLIAIFDGQEVPEVLIDKYMSMFPSSNKNSIRDPDRTLRCAYNFPAVLMTLGSKKWPDLAEDYIALCRDTQLSVRRTLAYSLHEVAKLLKDNSDACDRQLAPLFGFFMMDTDEIRIGVLQNASAFLECLSPSTREMYLSVLEDIWEAESRNWRIREHVAQQLPALCNIYPDSIVVNSILPIAVKCLNDPVSRVRETAVSSVPIIYTKSKDELGLSSKVFETILKFGLASSFRDRMIFVQICQALLEIHDIDLSRFGEVLMPVFYQLSNDKVANVRLLVAHTTKLLITLIYDNDKLRCSEKFLEQVEGLVARLSNDSDPEIRSLLSESLLNPHFSHIVVKESNGDSEKAESPIVTQNGTHEANPDLKSEAEDQVKDVAKQTENIRISEPVKITRVVSASNNSKPLDLIDSDQQATHLQNEHPNLNSTSHSTLVSSNGISPVDLEN
ncbi:ARM repeat-containing protein [Basidiobolus meristosporus CBS 931.73]|uniref:ARM repeat-containing protein n=1 Tax=Basidiobolus meristosporus CBS 931.73 TaxID=1314790 RepID=A0A1Y1YIY5_9FUNG|nr:ARM repeat-containing protein [Basidiobolus meristosporus CBS 931.73]|eukprot:ORX97981.1 ARM repeat-containing protein [Basidiobolus meristosporus CBS 931.73]